MTRPRVGDFAWPTGIPTKRWLKVGNYDYAAPSEGLRSVGNEMWNPYLHPERIFNHREVEGKRTTWFDQTDQLSVDPEKACAFITCIYPTMVVESRHYSAADSATFWLNEEIVTLPVGHAHRYQEIALRNRYFANLAERFDLATPEEMNAYLIRNSITNAEHAKLIPPNPQADMFGAHKEA